jgi:ArsR family transcriptional regulator, arsenate/arsenite/antimonite-responsive transcriptional repressor
MNVDTKAYDAHMARRERPTTDACCTLHPQPASPLPADRDQVLGMFKALADGTRFEIFRLIEAQDGPLCACDIVDRFDVSQPTIAHHLRVLREAGLITVSRQGVWAYYQVNPAGIDAIQAVVGSFSGNREAAALQEA